MKIGIYGQFYHEDSEIYIQHILEVLQKKKVDIVVEEFCSLLFGHDGLSFCDRPIIVTLV